MAERLQAQGGAVISMVIVGCNMGVGLNYCAKKGRWEFTPKEGNLSRDPYCNLSQDIFRRSIAGLPTRPVA